MKIIITILIILGLIFFGYVFFVDREEYNMDKSENETDYAEKEVYDNTPIERFCEDYPDKCLKG